MEKYRFETDFLNAAAPPPQRPKRSFRPEELEAARAEAYAAGRGDALAEAERQSAKALDAIARAASETINALRLEVDQVYDNAVRLAAEIARRFVREAVERAPEDFLDRCFAECLDVARKEPRIMFEIPEALAERLRPRIETMARERGFDGVLLVRAAKGARIHARIDWGAGGAEIALEEALGRMSEIISTHLDSLRGADVGGQRKAG